MGSADANQTIGTLLGVYSDPRGKAAAYDSAKSLRRSVYSEYCSVSRNGLSQDQFADRLQFF